MGRDRQVRFKVYPHVVLGCQVVDWLLWHGLAAGREAAVHIGQLLVDAGHLAPVPSLAPFQDGDKLFQLVPPSRLAAQMARVPGEAPQLTPTEAGTVQHTTGGRLRRALSRSRSSASNMVPPPPTQVKPHAYLLNRTKSARVSMSAVTLQDWADVSSGARLSPGARAQGRSESSHQLARAKSLAVVAGGTSSSPRGRAMHSLGTWEEHAAASSGSSATSIAARSTDNTTLVLADDGVRKFLNTVHKAGTLRKQSARLSMHWRQRWIVLQGTSLLWYKKPTDSRPNGDLDVRHYNVEVVPVGSREHCLRFSRWATAPPRPEVRAEYVLGTESAVDARNWLESIQAAVDMREELEMAAMAALASADAESKD